MSDHLTRCKDCGLELGGHRMKDCTREINRQAEVLAALRLAHSKMTRCVCFLSGQDGHGGRCEWGQVEAVIAKAEGRDE